MKSVLNDFANDTDADLAAYVQMYRTRIADRTDEIGPVKARRCWGFVARSAGNSL
jgi:hypothetical protein